MIPTVKAISNPFTGEPRMRGDDPYKALVNAEAEL